MLAEEIPADSQQSRDLAQIRAAAQRAGALTHQLLAFSRRQVLAPQRLRLQDVLSSVRPMLERLLGGEIVIEMPPSEAAPIRADLSQLEQIVLNLAVNARDAMPGGGVLRFDVDDVDLDEGSAGRLEVTSGRYVRLNVSDTGTGMDAVVIEHLFEPFFTTKPEGEGTGLGLATVHGIVKQSRGGIEVRSEAGRGTTFFLYFPAASA